MKRILNAVKFAWYEIFGESFYILCGQENDTWTLSYYGWKYCGKIIMYDFVTKTFRKTGNNNEEIT